MKIDAQSAGPFRCSRLTGGSGTGTAFFVLHWHVLVQLMLMLGIDNVTALPLPS